jgi:hypothetical protein
VRQYKVLLKAICNLFREIYPDAHMKDTAYILQLRIEEILGKKISREAEN